MLTANHTSPTTATHDQPDEQRLADLRQLDERIAQTRLLLRGLRDERDRLLSAASIATRGAYQAQCLMTAGSGEPTFVPADDLSQESVADGTSCQPPAAGSLLTDSHLAAQADGLRLRAERIEDYRYHRRVNAARRISPREQREMETMQQTIERDAAHALRLDQDASEPGRDWME